MGDFAWERLRQLIAKGHPALVEAIDGLSPAMQEKLRLTARLIPVAKGDVVAPADEIARDIGYVIDGALGMTKILADGHSHLIGMLLPTDMFGRLFDGPNHHRLEALTDGALLCFDRFIFEHVLREAPALERMLLVTMLDELDVAREWVLVLNGTRVVQRIAAFLIILSHRQSLLSDQTASRNFLVEMPFGRRDLSRCLGVRPESLSRALHRLSRDGVIQIHDANLIEILDMAALLDASGQDLDLPVRGGAGRRTI